jgi:hypothetical protein
MRSQVINRVTLHSGGATAPTFELYQLASGRCRLWAYWFDQDGQKSETIAAFHEPGWAKAQRKAQELLKAALAGKPGPGMKTQRQPHTRQ